MFDESVTIGARVAMNLMRERKRELNWENHMMAQKIGNIGGQGDSTVIYNQPDPDFWIVDFNETVQWST